MFWYVLFYKKVIGHQINWNSSFLAYYKDCKNILLFALCFDESAKLRALRARVPTCLVCLRAYVPCMLTCSGNIVPCVLTCSRNIVPCVLTCSRAYVPFVLTCSRNIVPCVLTCSRVYVPCVLPCSRPMCLACLRDYMITCSCLACLRVNVSCVLCVPTWSRAITTNDKYRFSITCFPYIFVIVFFLWNKTVVHSCISLTFNGCYDKLCTMKWFDFCLSIGLRVIFKWLIKGERWW